MKPYLLTFLFTLPLFTSVTTTTHRRILHQPLFPANSAPPPPPPASSSDNPFFNDHTPDPLPQSPPSSPPPPPPDTAAEEAAAHRNAPPPGRNSGEKIKIMVLVGVVSVVMLWGFVFFIYKYKLRKDDDPTTFRYVGPAESPITATELANGSSNGSPYYRLNGVKVADRYRPSPELQPLPPLSKLKPAKPDKPPAAAMACSDDEEIHDFYTPNGSIVSTDGGFSVKSLNLKPVYYSKRSSPRSRFSVSSSPETMPENSRPANSPAKQPPPITPPEKPHFLIKTALTSSSKQQLRKSDSTSPAAKLIPKIIMSKEDEPGLKPDKLGVKSDGSISSFSGSSKKEETQESAPENRVLDPKKSHNIAILLNALHVTQEEVYEALVEGNADGLGAEMLETLLKVAPMKEEEIKLKDYDISKLESAERFLKAVLDIPFAFKRVEALLYRENFENEVKYLRSSFQTLEAASEELKNSRLFLKLLEAVLQTGNLMNVGTNHGEATAFKLDTLLKLVDIKGTDGKTTLLHYVVQEIIRSEGVESNTKTETNPAFSEGIFKKQGLQISDALNQELSHVKKAAGMDSHVLSGYVTKLELELQKIQSECNETQDFQGNFYGSMRMFVTKAETELRTIKIDEKKALESVKDVTEHFDGDSVKEGVYPLRIFMIVRDFIGILNDACNIF
ncbi:putative formin, FH2 domain-containing protein [Helianthus annuus]|nr:putative formin, FH2 domain-containing protein [Helianthus annuus]